jgi:hypothetical protein
MAEYARRFLWGSVRAEMRLDVHANLLNLALSTPNAKSIIPQQALSTPTIPPREIANALA